MCICVVGAVGYIKGPLFGVMVVLSEYSSFDHFPNHACFFSLSLSNRTHMQDLKDMTNDNHYENYRCEKLAAMTVGSPTNQPNSK